MRQILQKIKKTYKEEGIRGVLKKSKQAISDNVYFRRFSWHERDLSLPIIDVSPRLSVSLGYDSRDEVIKWIKSKIYNGVLSEKESFETKVAIANNHFFPSIKLDGEIIGFMKVGFNKVYIKNFKKIYSLRKGTAFIYASYVDPKYRGSGIYTFSKTEMMKFLKGKGFQKLASQIRSSNGPSKHVAKKCGSRRVDSSWQFRCFDLNIFTGPPEKLMSHGGIKKGSANKVSLSVSN